MKEYFKVHDDFIAEKVIPEEFIHAYQDAMFDQREIGEIRSDFVVEKKLLSYIANGDIAGVENMFKQLNYRVAVGHMSDDPLRQARYAFVAAVTQISRYAIQGGMTETDAMTLSDTYIQKMDKLNSPQKIMNLIFIVMCDFTEKVKKAHLKSNNPVVSFCRNYIASHLHGKITLADLCQACRCSPNYLTELFKHDTGVTPHQYITSEKMKLARYILANTEYSIFIIADFLGYSTSSHFISIFKTDCGVTPNQYRKLHLTLERSKANR